MQMLLILKEDKPDVGKVQKYKQVEVKELTFYMRI